MNKKPRFETKTGKFTGYETDGTTYRIAPTWCEQFNALRARRNAVEELVIAVQSHAEKMLAECHRLQLKVWQEVTAELGLDHSVNDYSYDSISGTITRMPKPEPESKAKS